MNVSFQADNGKFISAEGGGDDIGLVHANRDATGAWETFILESQGPSIYAIKSEKGRYLSAEGGGGFDVHCNRTAVGPWEHWSFEHVTGETYHIKSFNGHYLCAELNKPLIPVDATRASAGAWETFTVKGLSLSAVKPIHIENKLFVDDTGQRWVWKGSTDFLLFKKYLDGQDIQPILDQRKAAGANLVRVLGMCWNIQQFSPKNYTNYGQKLGEFVDFLGAQGFYIEFVVFADAQYVMSNEGEQQGWYAQVCAWLNGKTNVFVELVNEYSKNGVNPSHFNKQPGPLQAHGSGQSDENPAAPAWDFSTFHTRRDWKWCFTFAATSNEVQQFPGLNAGVVNDEPLGADEVDRPGSRSSDVNAFFKCGAVSSLFGMGGTFHSQAGLTSDLWGPVQQQCAEAFFKGLDAGKF